MAQNPGTGRGFRSTHQSNAISFECYPGVFEKTLISTLVEGLRPSGLIVTSDLMKSPSEIELLVSGVLGDDPVFGRMNCLKIEDFFDNAKLAGAREQVKNWKHGVRLGVSRAISRVEGSGLAEASPCFVRVNGQNLATKPMVNMLAVS